MLIIDMSWRPSITDARTGVMLLRAEQIDSALEKLTAVQK